MHELTLLMNLVDIAEKEAKNAHAKEVKSITLEIGQCAGIDQQAFDFSWPFAVKNTALENADRIINSVKAKAICLNCSNEFALGKIFDPCPLCGSYCHEIIQGKDLKIKSMAII